MIKTADYTLKNPLDDIHQTSVTKTVHYFPLWSQKH